MAQTNPSQRRLVLLGAVFALFAGLLVGRLWVVQVHQGSEHTDEIRRQSYRRIRLSPVRGRIIAGDGAVLADTTAAYDLIFHVSEMRQPGGRSNTEAYILATAGSIAERFGRPNPLSQARVERHLNVYPALPLTVFTRLSERELALIAEWVPPWPSVEVKVRFVRQYPLSATATHVLGFTGRTKPPDHEELKKFSYVLPEPRGRDGLELVYDEVLAGKAGMRLVRVDTLGYVHDEIGEAAEPENGDDLVLTINSRAQVIAERLLAGFKGGLVLVEADTGAILAMASAPTYDLSKLTAGEYGRLANDAVNRPLVNRAISAGYIPGSIVKPLIGLAALKAGVVDAEATRLTCLGSYRLGNTSIGCWRRDGHGEVDLTSAIEQSCNTFFIAAGQEAGLDRIRPMLLAAGFGQAPAIELPNCGRGLVPSREWAQQYWGRSWLAIDTAYLSIGQGAINISPLQAALYAGAIANGGTVYKPTLVRQVCDSSGRVRKNTVPQAARRLPVTVEQLGIIQRGMVAVVSGENATAATARNQAISLAGKTGTAEVVRGDDKYNNAWFICYGPVEDPKYALAIVIERGVSGGRTAAPLAGQFFDQWLGTAN
jgi:penicillin-binding protein 2